MIEAELLEELKAIRQDLKYIKEHMVDKEMLLSPSEEDMVREAIEEYERGETITLTDLKRDRGDI